MDPIGSGSIATEKKRERGSGRPADLGIGDWEQWEALDRAPETLELALDLELLLWFLRRGRFVGTRERDTLLFSS
ncbi:hypothetical protein J5N97_018650 [Dioscorea zingiberensis]|uniref:Uncharacterized protein n=1 Tax=Dioscorea zingiberensis TaxID=325984 RepID=A0A9D5CCN0_9LILI|nr:hypothetical protein J5N97_018650 [Dioscorea zingiberensis]